MGVFRCVLVCVLTFEMYSKIVHVHVSTYCSSEKWTNVHTALVKSGQMYIPCVYIHVHVQYSL